MLKYHNRCIFFTNTSIISIDTKNGKADGLILVFDRFTGVLERSCEYKDNLPSGMYREYHNDKISYEKYCPSIENQTRMIAEKCAYIVLVCI